MFLAENREVPRSSDDKASACSAGDPSSVPGSRRSPGERIGYPLQYSCLENPTDRGAWRATVHGVAKSGTRLSDFTLPYLTSLILGYSAVGFWIISKWKWNHLEMTCGFILFHDIISSGDHAYLSVHPALAELRLLRFERCATINFSFKQHQSLGIVYFYMFRKIQRCL